MMYMPKHIRIGKTLLISFYYATLRRKAKLCSHFVNTNKPFGFALWAPQIFVSGFSNRLTVALAMAGRGFQAHLSKI